MQSINWQQFGLRKNPYDTMPLIEGGDLPIAHAFIGRVQERKILNALFESEDRLCLTICGNVGVGKTSLANVHKFQWKHYRKKPLFSFRREIEASEYLLNKKNFIIELIGSVLREINLIDPVLMKHPLLKKLNHLVDLTQALSLSLSGGLSLGILQGGASGNISLQQPLQLSLASLEQYLQTLLAFIKTHKIAGRKYQGLIVHVNNFDIVLTKRAFKEKVEEFFQEIRDLLQTRDLYFLFLGPTHFFRDIIRVQSRVRSIFYQTPLILGPLSKAEIISAFEERMNILKSEKVKHYIKPFHDEVIYKLYDLFEGDIRSIMSALNNIVSQYPDKLGKTLTLDESMILLGRSLWEKIEQMLRLTHEQKNILIFLAQSNHAIAQRDIAKLFKKTSTNVSGYYFRPLRDAGIIEVKSVAGKIKYWTLTENFLPLKEFLFATKKLLKNERKTEEQLALF